MHSESSSAKITRIEFIDSDSMDVSVNEQLHVQSSAVEIDSLGEASNFHNGSNKAFSIIKAGP